MIILMRLGEIDKNAFQRHDAMHVREKFTDADGAIIERLGNANTQRRRYLEYNQQHNRKLSDVLDSIGVDEAGRALTLFSATIAAEFECVGHVGDVGCLDCGK